ncbi:MAG: FAD-binding protein [Oscillospiraceae bacterium]|jgi:flavin-dependent dehydrogenase
MFDIAIIGLGPAGAVLASLIDKKYSVICFDLKSGNEDSPFKKPCGGLLAPDAQKALAGFDIPLPNCILADPQIFAVKTIDLYYKKIRHYQRMYVNLNRHRFDIWLKSLIPENVTVKNQARCTSVSREKDGFLITVGNNGINEAFHSKYIVGADGANSIVRRTFFPKRKIRSYMSIQQWFSEANPIPFYSCIFDPENTDCYSWTISKDGCFIFGGAYPVKDSRKHFENQKTKLEGIGMKFGKPIKTEACLVLRPKSRKDFICGGKGVFLTGEAAGFISPSSLEGISSAIISARCLSKAFNSGENPEKEYKRRTLRLRFKLWFKIIKCPFMYFPPLRFLMMKLGIMKISVLNENEKLRF